MGSRGSGEAQEAWKDILRRVGNIQHGGLPAAHGQLPRYRRYGRGPVPPGPRYHPSRFAPAGLMTRPVRASAEKMLIQSIFSSFPSLPV